MELAHTQLTRTQKKEQMMRMMMSTSFRIGLIAWIIVFGVLYVIKTTGASTRGYDIAQLERQKTALEHENKRLDVDIATNRSMQSIQDRLTALHMVPATDIRYIAVGSTEVARR